MKKRFISATLIAATLMFSACGDGGDGESALETQQLLDNGNFSAVIAKLESSASTQSDYLALASAYMGKAGFSLSSIVGTVIASGDSNESSSFSSYVTKSSTNSNSRSLGDLDTAVSYYQKVVNNTCLDANVTKNSAEKDICLYVGLSKVSQTAVAISYIVDDIDVLSDTTTGTDNKLTTSTCAMEYAAKGTSNAKCTFSSESNVTFTKSNKIYGDINITVNGATFEYLITPVSGVVRSTAITNGFCTLDDFTTRVSDKNASSFNVATFHACPLNENNDTNDSTTEDILVKALNDGVDSIGSAVSEDVKKDIEKFKNDVLKANGRANDVNTTIAIDDIIKYLEQQNQ